MSQIIVYFSNDNFSISYSVLDNTLFFWKYPEEEEKNAPPCFQISLHNCITQTVTLAPREICSRMNTFMLENQRPIQHEDRESQNIHVVRSCSEFVNHWIYSFRFGSKFSSFLHPTCLQYYQQGPDPEFAHF